MATFSDAVKIRISISILNFVFHFNYMFMLEDSRFLSYQIYALPFNTAKDKTI